MRSGFATRKDEVTIALDTYAAEGLPLPICYLYLCVITAAACIPGLLLCGACVKDKHLALHLTHVLGGAFSFMFVLLPVIVPFFELFNTTDNNDIILT